MPKQPDNEEVLAVLARIEAKQNAQWEEIRPLLEVAQRFLSSPAGKLQTALFGRKHG